MAPYPTFTDLHQYHAALLDSGMTYDDVLLYQASLSPSSRLYPGCEYRPLRRKRRLVGIETNPGPVVELITAGKATRLQPQRSKARKQKKKKKSPVSQQLTVRRTATQPFSQRRTNQRSAPATLQSYVRALTDPWFAPPLRLGWGSFTPSSLNCAWSRYTQSLQSSSTCFLVLGTPFVGSASASTTNPGFIKQFESTSAGTNIVSSVNVVNGASVNSSVLTGMADAARVVSGALRVTVRYPATSVRGSIYGLFSGVDSTGVTMSNSFNTLGALFNARTAQSSAAGEVSIEVQYRPSDINSFAFNNQYVNGSGSYVSTIILPQFIVVGNGWPSGVGCSVETNFIIHYETLSGLDQSGEDDDDGSSLALSGITSDMAGFAATRAGQPVITSGWAIAALDSATSNLARAARGMGRGGRRLGLATGIGTQNTDPVLDIMPYTSSSSSVAAAVSAQPSTAISTAASSSSPPLSSSVQPPTPSGWYQVRSVLSG